MKTFKRDQVYVNELREGASVMHQLAGRVEHYNEANPHRGLLKSQQKYRRETVNT